jgi:hypothetical protein
MEESMPDGEEPVTSVEEPAPSPAPVEPSEQVATQETPVEAPVTPPSETPPETPAEQDAELDTETQKNLDKFLAELTPKEETPPPTDETVTLTKKELDAQIFRERQSAEDRAGRKATEAQAERERQVQIAYQEQASMHGEIQGLIRGYVDRAEEIPANFAEHVLVRGRQRYYTEGYKVASQSFALAALSALDTLDGSKDAPEEVLAPLQRQAKNESELFSGVLEVAHALGRRSLEGEFEKRVQAEVNKRVPTEVSVQIKKFMIQNRAAQPSGQLPEGSGAAGGDLTLEAYGSMSPEERRRVSKEQIDALTRQRMGVA